MKMKYTNYLSINFDFHYKIISTSFSRSGNCDSVSGECFKCLNNTDGDRCQFCKEGFYGDAEDLKDCQDCKCSDCGSEVTPCDRTSGQCKCKANIEGERCDKCKVRQCRRTKGFVM